MCTGSGFSHGKKSFQLAISSDPDLDERARKVVTAAGLNGKEQKNKDKGERNRGGVERGNIEKRNTLLHVGCVLIEAPRSLQVAQTALVLGGSMRWGLKFVVSPNGWAS